MKIKALVFLCITTTIHCAFKSAPTSTLAPTQIEHFRALIDTLPSGRGSNEKVIEIKQTLLELFELAQSKKIELSNLITKLKALAQKLKDNPSLKDVKFTSALYGQITLSQFSDILNTFIQEIERPATSVPAITKQMIEHLQEIINALPSGKSAPLAVNEIRLRLLEIFDLAQNKKVELPDLLAQLKDLALQLETNAQFKNVQFNSDIYGALTLSQFSNVILRNLIDEIEKRLIPAIPAQPPAHQPQPGPAAKIPHGLANLGNSCFMNASLQSLYALDGLTDSLLQRKPSGLYKPNTFGGEYINFIEQLRTSSQKIIEPRALCMRGWEKMHFPPLSQQDNDEFIITLLDELIGDINKDPLAQLLAITLQQYINNNPSSAEKTLLLSLPIPPQASTLDGCLNAFTAVEKVTMQEAGKEVIKNKQIKIAQTGRYLIIHLKRNVPKIDPQTQQVTFVQRKDPKTGQLVNELQMEKIAKPITFPLTNLNLNPYAAAGVALAPYRLKAMVIHAGSAYGGHYTGYVRYENNWYFVNDEEVKPVSPQEITRIAQQGYGSAKDQTPTTFFYERQ